MKHRALNLFRGHRLDYWLIGGLILALSLINVWWAQTETRPPHWDMARHLWTSLLYFNDGHHFLSLLGDYHYYPPLVYWLAQPWYRMVDTSIASAVASNVIFIGVLLASVYAIGRRLGGRAVALSATLLTASYPMLITQFKEFQLDAPLTAMVALALALLTYSEGFRRPRYTLAFGIICGLGMLTKWTFALCIGLPLLVSLWQAARTDFQTKRADRLKVIAVAALLAYVVASPWYIQNLGQLRIDMRNGGAAQAALEGDPVVGSTAANLWYLKNLLTQQVFLPGFLLFMGGLAWMVMRWRRLRLEQWYPLLLVGGIYLVFTVIANKDARYTMPLLPGVALVSTLWIGSLSLKAKRIAVGVAALYSLVCIAGISFAPKFLPSNLAFTVGDLEIPVYAERGYIIGPPTHEQWGLQDVFAYLSCQPTGHRHLVYTGPDTIWFNNWDFTYYAERYNVAMTSKESADYALTRSAKPLTGESLLSRTLPDGTYLQLTKVAR